MENGKRSSLPVSRRSFLEGITVAGLVAAGTLTGCTPGTQSDDSTSAGDTTTENIWGETPLSTDQFDFSDEVDCDLLVIGAGTSGMPAAISAAEEGLSVIMLEKQAGGFGMRTYIGAVGTSTQKAAGVDINKESLIKDMLRYSSYRSDANLYKLWADRSGEAIDWYTGLMKEGGMKVWLETDINSGTGSQFTEYPTCHMFYDLDDNTLTGTSIMAAKMEKIGVDVRYKTPMVQLIQENGKIAGAVAKDADGNYIRVNAAKGVVLATGGYAANTDMMHALNEKDWLGSVMVYCDPGATGDGITAAHFAGGQMDIAHTAMYFERGATLPGSVGGDVTTPALWWLGSQPFLQVNRSGERFANESLPYDYDLHQAAGQPGHVFVQIFDANWQNDVTAFHTIGCSRIVSAAQISEGYEAVSWTFEAIQAAVIEPALAGGQLVQADTIDELAKLMGMDPDVLTATVNRYNELCRSGEDIDYYKEPSRLRPVAKAPFYAVTVGGQLLCTMDGMWIDTDFHVLDPEGAPIDGLYAIGNDSGRYFFDCYPELVVGAAAGRSITFGYLLGKSLS